MLKRKSVCAAVLALAGTLSAGCSGVPDLPAMIGGDWEPPMLTGVEAVDERTVAMAFDEPVSLGEVVIDPPRTVQDAEWQEDALLLRFATPLAAGELYWVDARVEDRAGNMSTVLVSVYGLNPNLPRVLINEVVCEGSGNHPDWVELAILEDGNVGGLTLYEGSPNTWDSRFVFPQMEVSAGDMAIVHFKPQGIPEEITETEDPSASGGLNAHPAAWDMWVSDGDGIPNTTGALSLTPFPGGPVIDAFLYSTKTYEADDPLRGFGRASQVAMMEEIVAAGGWVVAGDSIVPEDTFNPEESTATRSINRTPGREDTDGASDWHIGPTSSASPGYPNTIEVHVP